MNVGIIGAGQLGLMLGLAGLPLNFRFNFLDPSADPPGGRVGQLIRAGYDDAEALARLAAGSDVVTFEFENVALEALERLNESATVYPSPAALRHTQDRLFEKQLFEALSIPIPAYYKLDSQADLDTAAQKLGLPCVVKTRRMGYDGKGQWLLREPADSIRVWAELDERPAIAEQWIDFDYEVSVIGARNTHGEVVVYPLTANRHVDGVLQVSIAPLDAPELLGLADSCMRRLFAELDYVGVLAIEFFVLGDQLLGNEYAPRVHNSGHWTIEGAITSQFENHLRAITGLPLGDPRPRGHSGMVNIIGQFPDLASIMARGGAHVHHYGKSPRPHRKLGHITTVADSAALRDQQIAEILQRIQLL